MDLSLGIACALVALVGWGLGDFFIQRATRASGVHETLFVITGASTILLLPFVWHDAVAVTRFDVIILAVLSVITYAYAIAIFEAFREGKLSIVESVVGLELPLTVLLAVLFGGEKLSGTSLGLFVLVSLGIMLAVTRSTSHFFTRHIIERGALLALAAAALSALTNFSIGAASQHLSPLLVIWFTHAVVLIPAIGYLASEGALAHFVRSLGQHPEVYLPVALFDNAAWVGFAYAAVFAPISLVATVSESYVLLAALLGHFLNHEKLRPHQLAGALIALGGIITFVLTIPTSTP